MRLTRRAAGLLAIAVGAVTCTDASSPTGPGTRGATPVRLGIAPSFSPTASRAYVALASLGITVTQLHVALTAADGRLALDTTIQIPPARDTLTLQLAVSIQGSEQTFSALFELMDATGMVLFAQRQAVTARAIVLPSDVPPVVTLEYTGPGHTARSVTVSPTDMTITAGSTQTLTASGTDSAGAALTNLLLSWRSSDTTLATVTGTGPAVVVQTTGRRGAVTITATLPTGVVGAAHLLLQPFPTTLQVVGGNAQVDSVGRSLAQPLLVKVTDNFNIPVSGATVSWTRIAGVGAVAAATTTTDTAGLARVAYVLGTTLGTDTVRAALGSATTGAASALFTARSISLSPRFIAALSGGGQRATILTVLPSQLVARVTDSLGNPVTGASVQWRAPLAASVTFAPATLVTGADGLAKTSATLGVTAGVIRMTADLGAVSAVFDGTALPGPASMLLSVIPHPDTITVDVPLPAPVQVRLADAHGNLVRAVGVMVRARRTGVAGSGAFADSAMTDTAGVASITIPPYRALIGQLALTLATNGLDSLTKPVTVLTGAPSQLGFAGPTPWPDPAATQAGVAIARQPMLQLYDVGGNPASVANVAVTAAVATGPAGSVLGGATALTDAKGVAAFSGLNVGGTVGTYIVQFVSGTFKPAVSGNLSIVAGVATTLRIISVPSSIPLLTGILSPPPTVQLLDAYGNGVDAVSVSVSLPQPTTALLTGPLTAFTDKSGTATFSGLTLVRGVTSQVLVFTPAAPNVPSVSSSPIPIL